MASKKLIHLLCIAFVLVWGVDYSFAPTWRPKKVVGMDYPQSASRAGIQGQVKLTLTVLISGTVTSIKAEGNPHPLLFDAAKENASKWIFMIFLALRR